MDTPASQSGKADLTIADFTNTVERAKGSRLLGEAQGAGSIELAPFEFEELEPMHRDHVRRKLGQPARSFGLMVMRQPGLRVHSYRTLAKVVAAGVKSNLSAVWGMIRRVHAGTNREPLNWRGLTFCGASHGTAGGSLPP